VSFFRLVGPFAHDKAWEVSSTELLAPVLQRGILTNLIFVVTMFTFGWISVMALGVEMCTNALGITKPSTRLAVPR